MQTKKIRIKKETYNKLVKKGKFGDSIDDIINRILVSIHHNEIKDIKTTQITNTIMNIKTNKKHQWTPHNLNE